MDAEVILGLVGNYGYLALFCCLFLGIVGLPINDETLVILAGFIAARGVLKPVPAFLVTYAGVLSGMNIGFFLGRWLGTRLFDWLYARSPARRRHVAKVRAWLDRRGAPVILLTYYIPGVRHVVPYLIGIGEMPYWKFAIIAFSGGLAWTSIFYAVGFAVGENWQQVAVAMHRYGLYAGLVTATVTLLLWVWRRRRVGSA